MEHQYFDVDGITTCVDCGASASENGEVVHYPNCQPGDGAAWAEYYSRADLVTCENCHDKVDIEVATASLVIQDGEQISIHYCPACVGV
jgi:hypothetical protein